MKSSLPIFKNILIKRLKNSINCKLIAIVLILGLYIFSAYHGYHEEFWNLPNRPTTLMQRSLFITPINYYLMPILTAILTRFFHKLTVVILLSIFLATVTYYLVELPFVKFKKHQSHIHQQNLHPQTHKSSL